MKGVVKGMVFILNPNPTSLTFYESLSFNTYDGYLSFMQLHLGLPVGKLNVC